MEGKKQKTKTVKAKENEVEESQDKLKTENEVEEVTNKETKSKAIDLDKIFEELRDEEENEDKLDIEKSYKKKLEIAKKKLIIKEDLALNAVKILKELSKKKFEGNKNLFSRIEDEYLTLNFVLGKLPEHYSIRPVPIGIPNSIYGDKFSSKICIIVKDPKSDFKDLGLVFPFYNKIIDIQKLTTKYSRFNERRDLVKSYDLFLCDAKIYLYLKRLLGKSFIKSKKYPIPVNFDLSDKEKLLETINNVVYKKTFFYMNAGPNYTVKFGKVVQSDEELVKNMIVAAKKTTPHILKWGLDFKDLKSISVKTSDSIELPVFNQITVQEALIFLDKV